MSIEDDKRKAIEVATKYAPNWATHFFIGTSADPRVLERRKFSRKARDEGEQEEVKFTVFFVAQPPGELTTHTIAAFPIKRTCRSCNSGKESGELFVCAVCTVGRCCAECGHHIGQILVCRQCSGSGPETTNEIEVVDDSEEPDHEEDCEDDDCEGCFVE